MPSNYSYECAEPPPTYRSNPNATQAFGSATKTLLFFRLRRRGRLRSRRTARGRRIRLRRLDRGSRCRRRWSRRRCAGRRFLWRRTRGLLQHRTVRLNALVHTHDQRKRANHEHDGAPGGGLRQNGRRAAWPERGLAPCAAKRTGEVGSFTALQQHDHHQHQAIDHEKCREQPAGPAKANDNNQKSD